VAVISVRELAVLYRLVRLGIPHPRFIDIDAEAGDRDSYDKRHHGAGLFVRRVIAMMMEFPDITHKTSRLL
jgi:hypothetical protein